MGQKGPVPLRRRFHQGTKGRPFLISLVVLLELVPGTLFLKTLHPDRHLAIPVDFVEIVPGTDGFNSDPNSSLTLRQTEG